MRRSGKKPKKKQDWHHHSRCPLWPTRCQGDPYIDTLSCPPPELLVRAGPKDLGAAHILSPEAVYREGEGEGVGSEISSVLVPKGPNGEAPLFSSTKLYVGFGYCLLVPNKTSNER